MKKIAKNIIIGSSVILTTTIIGVGIYFIVKNKQNNEIKIDKTIEMHERKVPKWDDNDVEIVDEIKIDDRIYTHDNVFPRMNKNDYYKYIRYDHISSKPYFIEDVVTNFIKDLTARMTIPSGEIRWNFKQFSSQKIEIYIAWKNNKNLMQKTYLIETV